MGGAYWFEKYLNKIFQTALYSICQTFFRQAIGSFYSRDLNDPAAMLSVTHFSVHPINSVLTRLVPSLTKQITAFTLHYICTFFFFFLSWDVFHFSPEVILFFFFWHKVHFSRPTNNQFIDLTHIQLFVKQLDLLLELLHLQLPVRNFLSEVTFIECRHILVSLQIKLLGYFNKYKLFFF